MLKGEGFYNVLGLAALFFVLSIAGAALGAIPLAISLACFSIGASLYLGRKGAYSSIECSFLILLVYYMTAFYLVVFSPLYSEVGGELRLGLALVKNISIFSVLSLAVWEFLRRGQGLGLLYYALILIVSIGVFKPVAFQSVKFQYLANTYIPILLVLGVVRFLVWNDHPSRSKIYAGSYVLILGVSCVLGALVTYGLIPTSLLATHQESKGYSLYNNLPRVWWSVFGDYVVPRFPGTSDDPILFGYISAGIALVCFACRRFLWFGIAAVAVLLSLSKGAIIWLLSVVILVTLLSRVKQKKILTLIYTIALVYFYLSVSGSANTSANVHIVGLLSPIESAMAEKNIESLLGHGVGSSGNLVKIHLKADMEDEEWLGGGAESGIGLLVYQLGLLGAGLVIAVVFSIYRRLSSDTARSAWLIYWVNVLLQENLINLNYLVVLAFAVYSSEMVVRSKAAVSYGRVYGSA